MSIKKTGDEWLLDFRPEGREGKRIRKKFDTKTEATRYQQPQNVCIREIVVAATRQQP